MDDFPVHDDFDGIDRLVGNGEAGDLNAVRFGRLYGDTRAGLVAIHPGEKHGAGRDEAAAIVETAAPRVIAEAARAVYIDASEAERHGMHTVGGAGARAQTKTAIEQRVVIAAAVIDPVALGARPAIAGKSHEISRG